MVSPRHLGSVLAEAGLSLPAHPHLEGQPRSRLRAESRADPRVVRAAAAGRAGRQLRPDGAGQPAPDRRGGLGAARAPRAPARRLQPPRRHPLRLRRLRRPRRPAPRQAAPEARRQRHARPSCARSGSPIRPARRIYWIQDNLSANWIPDIRAYASHNRIELVPTPTYASYLNPVECHFSAAQPVRRLQRRLPRLGRLRLRARPPRPLPQRRPPRPPHRRRRSPPPDRRLMPLRVQQNLKGH